MHMITSIPSLVPTVTGPSSLSSLEALMGGLKSTIRRRLVARYRACLPDVLVHRAIDDAEQLARSTELAASLSAGAGGGEAGARLARGLPGAGAERNPTLIPGSVSDPF